MKKRRLLAGISGALGVLLLAGCGGRVLAAEVGNRSVAGGFERVAYRAEQYERRTPVEQLDFGLLGGVSGELPVAHGKPEYYTLSDSLRFYSSPDDSRPVAELPKGTVVFSLPPMERTATGELHVQLPAFGYGFLDTMPTYERGWRYTRLMMREGESGVAGDRPRCYLRTEDVLREMSAYLAWKNGEGEAAALPASELVFARDRQLYQAGAFISPNLLTPVWDGWNTALAALGAALLLACALLFPRKAGKRRPE